MSSSLSFKDLSLTPPLQQGLDAMAFTTATEIQAKTIPLLLGAPRVDFHGQAQTGTGKTLAFGIPLLQKIDPTSKAVQALIVAPTRELVVQICQNLRQAAQFMAIKIHPIYGGVSMEGQMRALRQGVNIVVGTPGRLNDHIRRGTLSLKNLETLVLDEADIMLDMGFKEEVNEILAATPSNRQIWLFSATVKPGIDQIKQTHMKSPKIVSVSKQQVGSSATKQFYCVVPLRGRLAALTRFIDSVEDFYGFIFCQTKLMAVEVGEGLAKIGYKAGMLHGDMGQDQRNRTIKQFGKREITILVATDIAARGIDIPDITHVINYVLPNDQESYIHRIGRTGRVGKGGVAKEGIAITFVNQREQFRLTMLQRRFKMAAIDPINVPSDNAIMLMQKKRLDEALSGYIQALQDTSNANCEVRNILEGYAPDQLKNVLASLLKEKFFKPLNKVVAGESNSGRDREDYPEHLKEIYLNVGSDDGVTKGKVIDYVKARSKVAPEVIEKIRIIKRRTFLMVQVAHLESLVRDLQGHTLNGRKVRAQKA